MERLQTVDDTDMRPPTETVSFRADAELLKLIDAERARFDLSRGHWVRGIIESHLLQPNRQFDPAPILDRMEAFERHFTDVRQDTAKALYFILTRIGKFPGEQAKELIRAHFVLERE